MEINELMIGDWVLDGNHIARVVLLTCDGIIGTTFNESSNIEVVEPILLTPEILEKNGFDISDPEVKQYHFEEDGQRYHFSLRQMYNKDNNPDGYSFFAFNVLTIIDYVHQLQHAFRLCSIDKEIEL